MAPRSPAGAVGAAGAIAEQAGAVANEEEDEEEGQRRRSSTVGGVAPGPEVGIMWPGLYSGYSAQEEEWELPASERARAKVRAVESPPREETDA